MHDRQALESAMCFLSSIELVEHGDLGTDTYWVKTTKFCNYMLSKELERHLKKHMKDRDQPMPVTKDTLAIYYRMVRSMVRMMVDKKLPLDRLERRGIEVMEKVERLQQDEQKVA